MALSAQAIRAIAIRRSIARRNEKAGASNDNVGPANDNHRSRSRTRSSARRSSALQSACIAAAGFTEHAAY